MRPGLLKGGKIDAVRAPRQQGWIFVEGVGEHPRSAAIGRYHSDLGVQVKVELFAVSRLKSNLFTIWRPHGIRIRPWRCNQRSRGPSGGIDHIDILRTARRRAGIMLRAEGDSPPVGRPRKSRDGVDARIGIAGE